MAAFKDTLVRQSLTYTGVDLLVGQAPPDGNVNTTAVPWRLTCHPHAAGQIGLPHLERLYSKSRQAEPDLH